MKVMRRFIWADHDTGSGWIPVWIPRSADFNPVSAGGFFHDMLEHGLTDKGVFADECMAFGRAIALRVDPGVIQVWSGDSAHNLGRDLFDALRGSNDDYVGDISVPRVGPMWEYSTSILGTIKRAVDSFSKAMREDMRDSANGLDQAYLTTSCTRVASLLNLGYRDALRRYGGESNCASLGWSGDHFGKGAALKIPDGEDDDILTITIDTKARGEFAKVRLTSTDHYDEVYGDSQHPAWARALRAQWYRS
jgi:hypothetical protein